jgi:hypothetical protein
MFNKFVHVVRVLTGRGEVPASRPTSEPKARSIARRYGPKARVEAIHLCEADGCPSHTPNRLCRRHYREELARGLAEAGPRPGIRKPGLRRGDRRLGRIGGAP